MILFTNIYRDYTLESVILGIVLFMSLLVHEYGHALTARFFGASPTINLEAFGGFAQYNPVGITEKQRFLITLNGPLLESLLIFLSYFLLKSDVIENYYFRYFLYATLRINIIWCLLNLIPVAPLDGGHLLRYLLEKRWGDTGTKVSTILGLVCVIAITPFLFVKGFMFFAMLLLIYGYQNYQTLSKSRSTSSELNHYSAYVKAMEAIKQKDIENAKVLLERLLKSKNEQVKHSATESLAALYFMKGLDQKAYDILLKSNHQDLKDGKLLLCKLAFKRKNYDLVANYSWDIYEIDPSFETALLNARAFAHLNNSKVSAGWLETASQFGVEKRDMILEVVLEADFDFVRESEFFSKFSQTLSTR